LVFEKKIGKSAVHILSKIINLKDFILTLDSKKDAKYASNIIALSLYLPKVFMAFKENLCKLDRFKAYSDKSFADPNKDVFIEDACL